MVTEQDSSSSIMLPYCKSLWQNPMHWFAPDNSFSKVDISLSKVFKLKASTSSGELKRLASLSQFLKH